MIDLRGELARATWSIGRRRGAPLGATLHYNGPPVAAFGDPFGERAQLAADARYHMRPDTLGADGIQYTFAVLSDGAVCRLRDDADVLWHSANAIGNRWHLAIHLPLGGAQTPTPVQWAATTTLCDSLIAQYGWGGRGAIVGHREWPRADGKPQKSCPGPIVFRLLQQWRGQLPGVTAYRSCCDGVRVRQGPGTAYKQAVDAAGKGIYLLAGDEVLVDAVVDGAAPQGSRDRRWAHLVSGAGFVHASLVEGL